MLQHAQTCFFPAYEYSLLNPRYVTDISLFMYIDNQLDVTITAY